MLVSLTIFWQYFAKCCNIFLEMLENFVFHLQPAAPHAKHWRAQGRGVRRARACAGARAGCGARRGSPVSRHVVAVQPTTAARGPRCGRARAPLHGSGGGPGREGGGRRG
jgi:hypothetical protein